VDHVDQSNHLDSSDLHQQNIARIYLYQKEAEQALEKGRQAYQVSMELDDPEEIAYSNELIARILIYQKDLLQAKEVFISNILLWKKVTNDVALSYTYYSLVLINIDLELFGEAKSIKIELEKLMSRTKNRIIKIHLKIASARIKILQNFQSNSDFVKEKLVEVISDKATQPPLKLYSYLNLIFVVIKLILQDENKDEIENLGRVVSDFIKYSKKMKVYTLHIIAEYIKFSLYLHNNPIQAKEQLEYTIRFASYYGLTELEDDLRVHLFNFQNITWKTALKEILNRLEFSIKYQNFIIEITDG
jgi:hypothetical protein